MRARFVLSFTALPLASWNENPSPFATRVMPGVSSLT